MNDDLISRRLVLDSLVDEYNKRRQEGGLKLAWIELAVNRVGSAWISVEERLPKGNERVLLYVRNWAFYDDVGVVYEGTIHEGHFGPRKKPFVWYLSDVGREVTKGDVTHWMPLPEKPE